ncbi:fibronectin type III domain-containing protein [Candidatus Bipolaricaulota bacterium]
MKATHDSRRALALLLFLALGILFLPAIGWAEATDWRGKVDAGLLARFDARETGEVLVIAGLRSGSERRLSEGEIDYRYASRTIWAELSKAGTLPSEILPSTFTRWPIARGIGEAFWEAPVPYLHYLGAAVLLLPISRLQDVATMDDIAYLRSGEGRLEIPVSTARLSDGWTGPSSVQELVDHTPMSGSQLQEMSEALGAVVLSREELEEIECVGSYVAADYILGDSSAQILGEDYSLTALAVLHTKPEDMHDFGVLEVGGSLTPWEGDLVATDVCALLDVVYTYGADLVLLATAPEPGSSAPIALLWSSENSTGLASLGAATTTIAADVSSPYQAMATKGSHQDRVVVLWDETPNAVAYEVSRAPREGGPFHTVEIVSEPRYEDHDVQECSPFAYSIRSLTTRGYGPMSLPSTGYVGLAPQPVERTWTDGISIPGGIQVAWTPAEFATSYRVLRTQYMTDGTKTKAQQYIIATTEETTFVDSDVVMGHMYHYRIRAENDCAAGVLGRSVSGVAMFPDPEDAGAGSPPPWIDATRGKPYDVVTVSWGAVSAATAGYRIYRALAYEGPYEFIAETTNTMWPDYDVELCGDYWYRVAAVGEAGEGKMSPIAYGSYGYRPVAPEGVRSSNGSHSDAIHLVWDSVEDAVRYHILRAPSEDGPFSPIWGTDEPLFVDGGLEPGQEFWYTVRASNPCGCSGDSGKVWGATADE